MTSLITRTRAAFRAFSGYDHTGGSGRWPASYALNALISQQLTAAIAPRTSPVIMRWYANPALQQNTDHHLNRKATR
jgi:hypothetical protein